MSRYLNEEAVFEKHEKMCIEVAHLMMKNYNAYIEQVPELQEKINEVKEFEKFFKKYFDISFGDASMEQNNDVAPVVHAYWMEERSSKKPIKVDKDGCPQGSCYCSNCLEFLVASDEYPVIGKYCPNCGAKMDEENTI